MYEGSVTKKNFRSIRHKINGRPDFIYKYPDGSLAIVEYKYRKKRVMPNHIAQLKAAAIAVKDELQCKVKHGFVLVESRDYEMVDLDKSSNELAKEIGKYLTIAKKVKLGHVPQPEPSPKKCLNCSYRQHCPVENN
ncbi:MAG: Dna2/Cas4 domain-containing protein [Gammaproteobacteria bacterium]|nr:Dna2/Cas4 domain-containing protein [Gammaproteobacteria bacterium]